MFDWTAMDVLFKELANQHRDGEFARVPLEEIRQLARDNNTPENEAIKRYRYWADTSA